MRLSPNHLVIEDGIPIPEQLDFRIKRSKGLRGKRTLKLLQLDKGKSFKIHLSKIQNIRDECSRYTALISKHKNKFDWKFKFKTTKRWLIITRLK